MRKVFVFIIVVLYSTHIRSSIKDSIPVQTIAEFEIVSIAKTSSSKTITPVQTINNEDIVRIGIQSVSDAVRRFSGVVVKDYGGVGGMKTVSLRGMGAQHTAVSYDGMTMSNAQSGIIDIGRFSLDNISEISLSIGQSDNIFQTARAFASAGVLSLETKAPYFSNKPYKGNIQIKTGSFGYFNPVGYYAHKINDAFSVSANVNWERTDGRYPYELPNVNEKEVGKRKNTDVDVLRTEINLYGDMGNAGQLKTKVSYFNSERGIPGQVIMHSVDEVKDRLRNKDWIIQANYKNKISSKFSVQSNIKFSDNYYNFLDARNSNRDKVSENEYYLSAGILYNPINNFSVSLTEDIAYNRMFDNFIRKKRDPRRITSLSLLASQYKDDYLTVTGSLLATYVSEDIKSGNATNDKKKITPFLGFSYRPFKITDFRLRAFYKQIFRLPTFSDMYYTGWDNLSLRPEYTKQYNLGVTWLGNIGEVVEYVTISVDGYRNYVEDKILPEFKGGTFSMRNFGKVEGTGLDVNLKADVKITNLIMLNLWGSYGYQKILNMEKGNNRKVYKHQLPHTPKHFGSYAISCENPWLNVSYSAVISGMRYWSDENLPENELEPYSDHTISLNKAFVFNDKTLSVQFSLLNVGNKNYTIVRYYPMPRRSFSLSANLSF